MIRKMKGKESSNTFHDMSVNNRYVTSHRDIDNALADNFSHILADNLKLFLRIKTSNCLPLLFTSSHPHNV